MYVSNHLRPYDKKLTYLQNPLYLAKSLFQYFVKKAGPLTNNTADFLAFEKIPPELRASMGEKVLEELSKFPDDWPEIEYLSGAGYVGGWSGLLFKRKEMLQLIMSAETNDEIQNREMDINMRPYSWHL